MTAQSKDVKIEAKKVTEQIYMLKGRGGNIGLFVGDEAVFMIDNQFASLTPKILNTIKTISTKPVDYVINTHWHGDHTGGNHNMAKEGAVIIAHKNVKTRLKNSLKDDAKTRKGSFNTDLKESLPKITFTEDMIFNINDEDMLISYVEYAHTDGDAIIHFVKNNVIHMGDTYFQGKFPYIDLNSGGNVEGYTNAISKVIMLANDTTKIIPGHGKLSNKAELKTYYKMLITIVDRIQEKIENEVPLEDVVKDKTITQEYEEDYGGGFISAEKFREIVYKSLNN